MASLNLDAELYDREFHYYVNLAKGLTENLRSKQDRRICVHWIRKTCRLDNTDIHVKSNRNAFLKYLLQIMLHDVATREAKSNPDSPFHVQGAHATLKTIQNPQWLESQLAKHVKPEQHTPRQKNIIRWSKDKRTYVAIQALPGQGALLYMAVAKDPTMGWDNLGKFTA